MPLFFVAEAEIFRDRWYWRDRRVAHAVRTWRIVYQPLTSTYRVTTIGGLSQTYATRAEAIASISRASRWKVAEPGQLEEGGRHYVEFQFRLDTTPAAAADADRHRRRARLAALGQAHTAHQLKAPWTPTHGAPPPLPARPFPA